MSGTETYTIERKLGSGAFGEVYLVSSKGGAVAVLKLPHKHQAPHVDQRRLREATGKTRAAAHAGIARPLGLVEVGERVGVVTEYVEGVDLYALTTGESLPPRVALEIAARAAAALQAVRSSSGPSGPLNWSHGDLKPSQVLVTATGGVKLVDFGLAGTIATEGLDMDSTAVFGSLAYMPPEQLTGASDTGDDVYSLGMITYELLTADRPRPATYVDKDIHQARIDGFLGKVGKVLGDGAEPIANAIAGALGFDRKSRPVPGDLSRTLQNLADERTDEDDLRTWAAVHVPPALVQKEAYHLEADKHLMGLGVVPIAVDEFKADRTPAPKVRRTSTPKKGEWVKRGEETPVMPRRKSDENTASPAAPAPAPAAGGLSSTAMAWGILALAAGCVVLIGLVVLALT